MAYYDTRKYSWFVLVRCLVRRLEIGMKKYKGIMVMWCGLYGKWT
jgi:hypothetical protein